jgi:hypothetical protein
MALLVLIGALGAVAQSDSNGMSVDSIMRAVPQAPVGHRQPRSNDVPYEENLSSDPISKEDAILDKKMKSICRGARASIVTRTPYQIARDLNAWAEVERLRHPRLLIDDEGHKDLLHRLRARRLATREPSMGWGVSSGAGGGSIKLSSTFSSAAAQGHFS